MRRVKKIICILMAAIMLVGSTPVMASDAYVPDVTEWSGVEKEAADLPSECEHMEDSLVEELDLEGQGENDFYAFDVMAASCDGERVGFTFNPNGMNHWDYPIFIFPHACYIEGETFERFFNIAGVPWDAETGYWDGEPRPYGFLGWFTAPEGGVQILPTDLVSDHLHIGTLYAQWRALCDGEPMSVSFSNNAGRFPLMMEYTFLHECRTCGVTFDTLFDNVESRGILTIFPDSDWHVSGFLGWFSAPEGGTQIMPTDLVSDHPSVRMLYAQWERSFLGWEHHPPEHWFPLRIQANGNGGVTELQELYFAVFHDSTFNNFLRFFEEPTREGYRFLGWFTASEGGVQILPTDTIGDHMIEIYDFYMYAQWEAVEQFATVTFVAWDPSLNEFIGGLAGETTTEVSLGGRLTAEQIPTPIAYRFPNTYTCWDGFAGLSFMYWVCVTSAPVFMSFTSEELTEIVITQDRLFAAMFYGWSGSKAGFCIMLLWNDGSTGANNIIEIMHMQDRVITLIPQTPSRAGYRFVGWASDPAGHNVFAPEIGTRLYGCIRLYAQWEAVEQFATVTFVAAPSNFGTTLEEWLANMTGEITVEVPLGGRLTAEQIPPPTGYQSPNTYTCWDGFTGISFRYWVCITSVPMFVPFTSNELTEIAITQDRLFAAYFQGWSKSKAGYCIMLLWNDGSTGANNVIEIIRTEGVIILTPQTPNRVGYRFVGWASDPAGHNAFDPEIGTRLYDCIRLYAQWQAVEFGGPAPQPPNGGGVIAQPRPPSSEDTTEQPQPPSEDEEPTTPPTTGGVGSGSFVGGSGNAASGQRPVADSERAEDLPEEVRYDGIHHAFMIGFEDGTVRPMEEVTRAQIATMIFRVMPDEQRRSYLRFDNSFSDVPDNSWFNNAVSTITNAGFTVGMHNGYFMPNNTASRAELTTMLARFIGVVPMNEPAQFNDIHEHWARGYINAAMYNGWFVEELLASGGYFEPDKAVTRAEAAAVINRALGRMPYGSQDLLTGMRIWSDNVNPNAWYYLYMQEATNSHYFIMHEDGIHHIWVKVLEAELSWEILERPLARLEDIFPMEDEAEEEQYDD